MTCNHDCLNCIYEDCISNDAPWINENADHYTIDHKKWKPRPSNYEKYKQKYSDYHKAYYQIHKEELKARQKVYDAEHKQERSEYQKKYRQRKKIEKQGNIQWQSIQQKQE